MDDELQPTPEGALIAEKREAIKPKLSQNAAAKLIELSGNRWRHIEKGYQTVAAGVKSRVVAPADTLAKMAQAVGVTQDELRNAGRDDAAEELARLDEEHQRWLEKTYKQPRLPRDAPNAPVLGEVDKALGVQPFLPGTSLPMSNTERKLLIQARNKLMAIGTDDGGLTAEETEVLTKFIEDDELRSLHARIDWLPRAEQLEVSTLVNELQLRIEHRWVADGFNNESERLPDYATPNPLPYGGARPDPADFPTQVPTFVTTEKNEELEARLLDKAKPRGDVDRVLVEAVRIEQGDDGEQQSG